MYSARCFLPWDGGQRAWERANLSKRFMRGKGFTTRVLRQLSRADGINATRTIFPQMYFRRQ